MSPQVVDIHPVQQQGRQYALGPITASLNGGAEGGIDRALDMVIISALRFLTVL